MCFTDSQERLHAGANHSTSQVIDCGKVAVCNLLSGLPFVYILKLFMQLRFMKHQQHNARPLDEVSTFASAA